VGEGGRRKQMETTVALRGLGRGACGAARAGVNPRGQGHAARAGASSTDGNERSEASGFCHDVTLLIFDIIFLLYIYVYIYSIGISKVASRQVVLTMLPLVLRCTMSSLVEKAYYKKIHVVISGF
jgi:hypothetical protein